MKKFLKENLVWIVILMTFVITCTIIITPIIWYHTNGHPVYHMPTDHSERINWNKLVDITMASFLIMWNMANEKTF